MWLHEMPGPVFDRFIWWKWRWERGRFVDIVDVDGNKLTQRWEVEARARSEDRSLKAPE